MPLALVLALSMLAGFNTVYMTGHNLTSIVKTIHHHTTHQVYKHVLKPAGHVLKKGTVG